MRVVEIREEAEWHQMQSAWEMLLRESASDTVFLTCDWLRAWWRSYGRQGELRILAAYDDHGALRGIAPLRCQTLQKYGQTVRVLSFIGDGSNDSDYLDLIVASGCEQQVLEAFGAHWKSELSQGTVLLLNEIPEGSPNLGFVKDWTKALGLLWKEKEIACGTVRLPATWEHYLSTLRPRFRTKIRSVLRNLEGRADVRFGFCQSSAEVNRMLPVLFDLHTRRWAEDGKPGVFQSRTKRDFYFRLSAALLERRWLRLSWLEWKGRVLACQYGFIYREKYFHLQEGYEPTSEHWNLGMGLRAWTFRQFLKEGVREYDFLGGVGRSKTDWGVQVTKSKQIIFADISYRNVLFCCGPEWHANSRETLRKICPERVLAARRTFLQKRSIATFQPRSQGEASESTKGTWRQQAIANCYFHLHAPKLMRKWRDRYQLSVRPKVLVNKRTEPSARILYYHRINDNRDPFYPAISTRVFEQEMRFVARHYKVVTLAELQKHLESGSPETVLAITFDDGYQDNYQNAFPILRRYGLPAAIFLTTGSIDSREPLWFEQLAGAFKTSAQEFIDIEINLPRRFWLRTEKERLNANTQVFQLLRGLADTERRQWLAQIHRKLAAANGGDASSSMLSWQQIRLMKTERIDFGGHTVTHPFLSKMTREQAAWEVSECKRRIEDELQFPATHFAYPNGREEDIGAWNKEIIREAGYSGAMTTIWGLNYKSTDPLELRRGQPWEANVAMFAYKLDWYQWVND